MPAEGHLLAPSALRRTRRAAAVGLLVAAALPLGQIIALANSPAPTGTINGTLADNGNGTETLTISGTWAFPDQAGDCYRAKRAAGYAIDWNDTSQPGNHVGTIGAVSVDVGAEAGNSNNPLDNDVHPTPVNPSEPAAWGGCGTVVGTDNFSSGTWGPISHTYPSSAGNSFDICAVTYDVHLDANGGQPNTAKETTAGVPNGSGVNNNGDNSTQGNAAVTGCQTVTPQPTTTTAEAPFVALVVLVGCLVGAIALLNRRRPVRAAS
jgi:hypothetical protein